eukprot:m.432630 g.432630  ORF g.432630 m.432630 type:complete len:61 (-) comp56751_c0_seq4:24-206(-)
MLINMFLSFGTRPKPSEVLYGDAEGYTQNIIQSFLVVVAVACVPVSLSLFSMTPFLSILF